MNRLVRVLTVLVSAAFLPVAMAHGQACKNIAAILSASTQGPTSPMQKFEATFGTRNPIIGMIHLAGQSNAKVLERAMQELALFEKTGVHAAIIENYHGTFNQVEMVLRAAQNRFPKVVLGVNILPNEYYAAFALAHHYGAKFIQMDFVSGRYKSGRKDQPITLDTKDYYEVRRTYPDILVLGGVHPKYYKPVDGSDLGRDIRTAKMRADAIVVTGAGTGKATPMQKIEEFRSLVGNDFPLVIGAGVTAENGQAQLAIGNGAIVGSYFKDGETKAPMIEARIQDILKLVPDDVRE